MRIDRTRLAGWGIVALFGSLVLGYSVAPTVTFEDSGEFITCAVELGIAHPSSYPLYCLLGKIFSQLPVLEPAWRLNIMSAFFTVMAALLCFDTVYTRGVRASFLPALGAGLLIPVVGEIWNQSGIAEVYSLNLFMIALIVRVQFSNVRLWRKVFLQSYLVGLGLGNHLTLVFLVPLLAIDLVWQYRKKLLDRNLLFVPLLFLVGFSIYGYLPVRSSAEPYLDWGNPETFPEMKSVLFQEEFKEVRSGGEKSPYPMKLRYFVDTVTSSFPGNTWIVLVLGTFPLLFIAPSRFFFISGLVYLYSIIVCRLYNVAPHILYSIYVFFIPALFALVLGFAISAVEVSRRLPHWRRLFSTVACAILFSATVFSLVMNFEKNNRRGYTFARDWALNVLGCVGGNALLVVRIDNDTFPLFYVTRVLKLRPDIALVNTIFIERPWYRNDLRRRFLEYNLTDPDADSTFKMTKLFLFKFIEQAKIHRPVYFLNIPDELKDPWKRETFGLVERAVNSRDPGDRGEVFLIHPGIPSSSGDLDREVSRKVEHYRAAHLNLASWFQRTGDERLAFHHYYEALKFNPSDADVWEDIGIGFQNKGRYGEALAAYEVGIRRGGGDESLFLSRGFCFNRLGFRKEEIASYRKAIELRPDYAKAYINLGVSLALEGRTREAIEVWKTGLKYDPENPLLKRYLAIANRRVRP